MMYTVLFTAQASRMLADISDRSIRSLIIERVERLAEDPEEQGGALRYDLTGYRSIRVVDQRYRIIYQIDYRKRLVVVIALGIRRDKLGRDIYRLAQQLIRTGLAESPN